MAKILKLLLVLLCVPLSVRSQTASLVADVGRARGDGEEIHSYPGPFMTLRGQAFFSAEEPSTGREMWVSDGTATGTELLVDACPGDCWSDLELLGSGGGGMFWAVGISSSRPRLWWSDGTRAGTRALRRDNLELVTPDGRHPSFVFAGGALYILGCARSQGCGLWQSDGTEEGTRPIVPDSPWQSGSLSGLQAVGSTFFFLAEDQDHPFQLGLWKTDGTEAGTVRVKDLEIYPRVTAATANRFFFVSRSQDGESDELWASDGTEAGTRRLASFPDAPSSSSEIPWLKPAGNRVYFLANDVVHGWEVWRSDGTPEGTERVTDFGFFDPFRGGPSSWQFEEVGGRVVFFATDGLSNVKLWATNGPGQPMAALAQICSEEESCDSIDSGWRLLKVGNRVVFRGTDAAHGDEIWSTDGTVSGTRRLSDVCPGPCSRVFAEPVLSGSAAWFTGEGDSHLEVWRTDGTQAGTRRFARLDATEWFLNVLELATAGNKIFLTAGDESGLEPWVSDGTPEGSGMLADIARDAPGSEPSELTPLGSSLVWNVCLEGFDGFLYKTGGTPETTEAIFESERGGPCNQDELFAAAQKVFFVEDMQLWATDGTAGGTLQLTHFEKFGDQRVYVSFAEHQGRLYFPVSNEGTTEIWRSDGTPAGTEKALEIPESGGIYHLTSLGSELYFLALDNERDLQVWKSDGTPAGTRQLADEPVSFRPDRDPQFVRLGGAVFFAGYGLWKTNGTPQGTTLVSALSLPRTDPQITDLQVFGGALYFFAWTSEGERALWRSDGTPAGTGIVKRFESDSSFARVPLTAFEGRLYFAADDGVHGRELWTSDGTASGTTLVRDVRPGPQPSSPASLVVAGGKLYFGADDGLNGTELWESDGTAAGTRLRQDLSPGTPSSYPGDLTVVGSRLYFSANDGATGRELWALPLDGPGGCQPSPTVLCLADGRFHVEAAWKDFEGRTGVGRPVGLTADTGYFWFFDASNVEVVVKVLDGQGVNGHHWVFYGALSSVEYSITVTDMVTGVSRRYFNPTGRLGSVGHTEAFGPRGAFAPLAAGAEAPPPIVAQGSTKAGACVESATRLCLNGGRFAVESTWKDFSGNTGTGKAVRLTGDTGYFWFFDAANVELVLKVLDGRPVNNKFWVFYGALSSVEYTITVTDTETGTVKTYKNPSGRLGSVGDTGAF